MGKRIGRFMAKFLMVVMTFCVLFVGAMTTRTFAGDKAAVATDAVAKESEAASVISGISGASIIVMIVVVLILGIIGALLLDSKKTLEK